MLNNTQANSKNQEIMRNIMFIIIGIICVISIILAIVFQVQQETTPKVDDKDNDVSEVEIAEFGSIFNNTLNGQNSIVNSVSKLSENDKVVYTKHNRSEKVDGKYNIDIRIPIINIDNPVIDSINTDIESLFRDKAVRIVENDSDEEIIYSVEYTAYINSNILSLAIRSSIKEGKNAQRVIVKTYTYDMVENRLLDINDVISIKQLDKSVVQKKISKTISENAKQAQSLIDLGYNVYSRDLSDEMYKLMNVNNFFYGPEGALYIIYAYGNNSYTSEMDIIPIK